MDIEAKMRELDKRISVLRDTNSLRKLSYTRHNSGILEVTETIKSFRKYKFYSSTHNYEIVEVELGNGLVSISWSSGETYNLQSILDMANAVIIANSRAIELQHIAEGQDNV